MPTSPTEIIEFFCNHLVGISFSATVKGVAPDQPPQSEIWSATYIEIDEQRFFLTAGHCVAEFEGHLSKGLITGYTCNVIDTLGTKAKGTVPIPFDYDGAVKHYFDDGKLDYALIEVRERFQKLLEANGIVPITEEHWEKQKGIDYMGHALLGIPAEKTEVKSISDGKIATKLEPTLIFLRPAQEPSDLTQSEERFTSLLPGDPNLSSIVGMSGGPVLGFADRNGLRYWIMAIQSSWNPQARQIYACRVPDIVKHFRNQKHTI